MGATLTDAVLQAGVNYHNVVYPRVMRIITEYPEGKTTSQFKNLITINNAHNILNWDGKKKIDTLNALIDLLINENIETEVDLREWIKDQHHEQQLFAIKGISNKTVDYIKKLVGLDAIAIDTHLFQFLQNAGIPTDGYEEAHEIFEKAASLLGVKKSALDYCIWKSMSEKRERK